MTELEIIFPALSPLPDIHTLKKGREGRIQNNRGELQLLFHLQAPAVPHTDSWRQVILALGQLQLMRQRKAALT